MIEQSAAEPVCPSPPCRGSVGTARRSAGRSDPVAGRRGHGWTTSSVLEFRFSSRERIEQAKVDWTGGRFGKVAGDDAEYIALPQ